MTEIFFWKAGPGRDVCATPDTSPKIRRGISCAPKLRPRFPGRPRSRSATITPTAEITGGFRNKTNNGRTIVGATTDYVSYLTPSKLKDPTNFLFIADDKTPNSVNNRAKIYYAERTWGGLPWLIHNPKQVNVAWGDGHVTAAQKGELQEKFRTDVAFVE